MAQTSGDIPSPSSEHTEPRSESIEFSMAPLTPASAAALARLRAYACPPSVYTSMPVTRRAAVLLLLFADRQGNLRVLLTLRASQMSSYSGQVALPGGKADSLAESAFDTARREAWEEVGLPQTDMPPPFRVEHLCELPAQLAITEQAVRPCVAFLHTDATSNANSSTPGSGINSTSPPGETQDQSISGESLIPKLNATEVAAVFSAPFHRFLSSKVEDTGAPSPIKYEGVWQTWHGTKWRMHNFFIPRTSTGVTSDDNDSKKIKSDSNVADKANSYRVWGLTARILIDSARIAYDEEPDFDYLKEIGEEKLLQRLIRRGKMAGEREKGSTMPRGKVEKEKSDASDSSESSGKVDRDTKL